MRVTFVLPNYPWGPVGGFAVVYEHANRLAARGHAVQVVHPLALERRPSPLGGLGARASAACLRLRHGRPPAWFELDRRVQARIVPDLDPERVPDGDVLVATAWQTAQAVATAPATKGRRAHLVQGYETWDGGAEDVDAALRLPLPKIAIARWLADVIAERGGGEATVVPNGLPLERFGIDVPPESRPTRVGFAWHKYAFKGGPDALACVEAVRHDAPSLETVAFGADPRPRALPAWVQYHQLPSVRDLRALYNSCAAFVQASWSEGWGLTATEAMLCGCALVTADNGGSREYAIDGHTALVAPARRPDMLAARLRELLDDTALRHRLAHAGRAHVEQFTWERATAALERALAEVVAG